MQGTHFGVDESIKAESVHFLNTGLECDCNKCFVSWKKLMHQCTAVRGGYSEGHKIVLPEY